ncbi:MAG: hypothetical protein CFH34_01144 [Alphaproteobacteria bacterium MarineAlpha9_Bin4]|nr:gamma-glutamylcyclotransferase [Pelagibacterales bacterium]PPR26066.1 MAG: hypothetical protein CFH34_01144 [Alphaproteobacteria bacterium MarineAlpha9_Bin4]|tara:strand:- start:72 stop:581 length:510 start_codon:yes stop_codon:yes gene_type:complete
MKLYGAYGSNLNIKQMQKRCPRAYPICSLYLDDYRLVFKGVADLEKKRGSISFIGVYDITNLCEKSLDNYEEYPDIYNKTIIKKNIEGRNREILIYTMNKKYKYAVPTLKYFSVIEKGFKNWGGSKKLLRDACSHSISNHTNDGYKSVNWKDSKYINIKFIRNRINLFS